MEKTSNTAAATSVQVRPLKAEDFEDAIAIDAANLGRRRRAYLEGRLNAALRAPADHVQFAATVEDRIAGYVLARRMLGEFGRLEPAVRLETIAVRPDKQGGGVGTALLGALEAWARKHGMRQVRTTAEWRSHGLLRFLDREGFELGRNHIIDCAVHAERIGALEPAETETEEAASAEGETDYGTPGGRRAETLARDRVEVHALAPADLAGVLAIDRRVTGHNRDAYLTGLFDEALNDSAVRVSMVARKGMTVGFMMARTDFGDFGRSVPTAVIDTIGVHPEFEGGGIGTALLSQLFVNLHALHIERVETTVAPDNFALLRFFYRAGFLPAQRLSLVKSLT